MGADVCVWMCVWGCELCQAFEHFVSTRKSYVTSLQQKRTDFARVPCVFTPHSNFSYQCKLSKVNFCFKSQCCLTWHPNFLLKLDYPVTLCCLDRGWTFFFCFVSALFPFESTASHHVLRLIWFDCTRNIANCRSQFMACLKKIHNLWYLELLVSLHTFL